MRNLRTTLRAALRAFDRRRRDRRDRRLIAASGRFDPDWYRERYLDVGSADPLDHYVRIGREEGRLGAPGFDPAEMLRARSEARRASRRALLGRLGPGRSRPVPADLAERLEAALPDFAAAEPAHAPEFARNARRDWSFLPTPPRSGVAPAVGDALDALDRVPDKLVLIPQFQRGGAERVALAIAAAAVEGARAGSVLVVATDGSDRAALGWLPEGCDHLIVPEVAPGIGEAEAASLVAALVFALRPAAVLCVNSRAGWEAIRRKGLGLSRATELYAALFAFETEGGRRSGYAATHLRGAIKRLTRVYCDSRSFKAELVRHHDLPPALAARIAPVPQPVPSDAPRGAPSDRAHEPFSVLWVGRIAPVKNLAVLHALIERAPDMRFAVYGRAEPGADATLRRLAARRDNLVYHGPYDRLADIPVADHSAFLFTSTSEGTPTTLLEFGLSGLPIVASDVGGVSDLIDDTTGWLVRRVDDPDAYLAALNAIRDRPDEADERAAALAERVRVRHSAAAARAALLAEPSFAGPPR